MTWAEEVVVEAPWEDDLFSSKHRNLGLYKPANKAYYHVFVLVKETERVMNAWETKGHREDRLSQVSQASRQHPPRHRHFLEATAPFVSIDPSRFSSLPHYLPADTMSSHLHFAGSRGNRGRLGRDRWQIRLCSCLVQRIHESL